MQIEGFNNLPRSGADRTDKTDETRRPERPAPTTTTTSTSADPVRVDSLETDVSAFIDRSVRSAGRILDARLDAVAQQRVEILRRADDPRSIRRAAESFLADVFDG